jgi:hypothetical protein
MELPGGPATAVPISRRTTSDPTADRKTVVDGELELVDDGTTEELDVRASFDDLDGAAAVDVVRALRRATAGRAAGLRRIVGSTCGGAGLDGDAPASALINPPLAPTTRPAVPNVGARLSPDDWRRSNSAAGLCPAIVEGWIDRMRLPVARARSSSGEW